MYGGSKTTQSKLPSSYGRCRQSVPVARSLGSNLYFLLSTLFQKTPLPYVTSATRLPIGTYKERTCGNSSELLPAQAEKTNSLVATPLGDLRFFFSGKA